MNSFAFALLLVPGLAGFAGGDAQGGGSGPTVVLDLPLHDGRIEVREVLEQLCREAGVDPGDRLQGIGWTLDVESVLGRLRLDILEELLPGAVDIAIREDRVVVEISTAELRDQVEGLLERIDLGWPAGPEQASFGMTVVTDEDPQAPLEALPAGTTRTVVLVHGLEDPGWTWRDLVPRLVDSGEVVVRFRYPGDQPIADSSDLFAGELRRLAESGVRRVDLVAHSMGGLIARDVLTRTAHYAGDGSGGGRYPAVGRLIMLGTPTHGAPLARLWGGGEATVDLAPGSDFLRRLNERPHSNGTLYTIVAGSVSPLSGQEIDRLEGAWERFAGDARAGAYGSGRAWGLLKALSRGLGDGIVSTDSARLAGVDDVVIVEANHLSMIVNVFSSERVPPAIPIVLDRLGGGG